MSYEKYAQLLEFIDNNVLNIAIRKRALYRIIGTLQTDITDGKPGYNKETTNKLISKYKVNTWMESYFLTLKDMKNEVETIHFNLGPISEILDLFDYAIDRYESRVLEEYGGLDRIEFCEFVRSEAVKRRIDDASETASEVSKSES